MMPLLQTAFQQRLLFLIPALFTCLVLFPSSSNSRAPSKNTQLQSGKISDVPVWAKQAVWYQIFPERFRNGDVKNDPTVNDIKGSWPHEDPKEWSVSRWTGDWYQLQSWESKDDKGFYFHAQQRRYGGDLQGVLDKLDYLNDLGVNALYFTPVFESPSLHKYDATMYHHIDNNFGPDPEGDRQIWNSEVPSDPKSWKWTSADRLFLKLVQEAHKRGMKVIIDGVFNHVGMTFWAFQDVRKNGEKSAFKDWFTINKWDDPSTPGDEFDYSGWHNVKELPELKEGANGFVLGLREHIHDVVKRWMDPNGDGNPEDGIDGWRLDVADMVAIPFWREFRQWVRSINPEAYTVGEVWWENWKDDKMFNAAPWLSGDVFDAVMNYRWAREVDHFFKDQKNKITVSELDKRLAALRNDYRSETNYVLMNLMDSHDTDRLASQIVNVDTRYDHDVGVSDNRSYEVRKPGEKEILIQKLVVLFQMTSLGAPMVYYGDEAGMWGADDPDERKPMLWADMAYENESSHPFGKPRPSDKNEFNADLFQCYKDLIAIRKAHPALSLGDFATLLTDDGHDTYAFLRKQDSERIVVVVNNSALAQQVNVRLSEKQRASNWRSLWESPQVNILKTGFTIKLNPKSGAILLAEEK
jgi:cyclomaltodextrinase